MAVASPTITTIGNDRDGSVKLVTWLLTNADQTGAVIPSAEWADRSVQVEGTWSTAVIEIEGSNDGTNFKTLTDPQGNAISMATATNRLEQIMELTQFIRPRLSTSAATASLTVSLLARRANPMRT